MRLTSGHYLGETLRRANLDGLVMTEEVYGAHKIDPPHSHEHANLCVVLDGAFTETLQSQSIDCSASTVLFSPPDSTHVERFSPRGARCFILEFQAGWLARWHDGGALPRDPMTFSAAGAAALARRARGELVRQDSLSVVALQAIALELVVTLARSRRSGRVPAAMARAEEYIRAHFLDAISLDDISTAACLHPATVARYFRRRHGMTVGEFIRYLRVEHAAEAIVRGRLSLADVAASSGFSDQSHLTRVFRRFKGTTPLAYRRSKRI